MIAGPMQRHRGGRLGVRSFCGNIQIYKIMKILAIGEVFLYVLFFEVRFLFFLYLRDDHFEVSWVLLLSSFYLVSLRY